MSKAIVFDLDGTLVDSAPDLMDSHNFVMRKHGYEPKPLSDIRFLAGRGASNMVLRSLNEAKKGFDPKLHKQMTDDFIKHYTDNLSKNSKEIKGVTEFLKWGQSQNISFAVCTNKLEYLAKKLLKEINLIHFFDFVAGVDTFEYKKPDPRHLTQILEIMDIEKHNTIMVGDSETDAETAKSAKINFVLVANGYTEKDKDNIHHDYFINDFDEMKGVIDKMRFLS